MKVLVVRFSSIGDIVLTTPIIRALKQQIKNIEVHYITKHAFTAVIEHNPNIDKLYTVKSTLAEVVPQLKKEKYDLDYDYVTYKYLLIGVNLVSKGVDFSAVSTKSAVDIIEGLDAMLKRPYIGKDIKFIYCDRGSEFINKQFLDWCAKRGITVRSGVVKRYSQHAVVDSFCRIISSVLAIKTTIEQSELNKVNDKANQREWLKYWFRTVSWILPPIAVISIARCVSIARFRQ